MSTYVHKTFDFKVRSDLSINNKDIESISVEISSNKKRSTLVNILFGPPNGEKEPFEIFLNNVFTETKNSNKAVHIAGDFNLNLLDHNTNRKIHNFLSLIYQNGMINQLELQEKQLEPLIIFSPTLSLTQSLKQ